MSNPLTDVLPDRARKYVYAIFALAAIGVGAWQAADGDWLVFAALVLGALGFTTAASNTPAQPPPPAIYLDDLTED